MLDTKAGEVGATMVKLIVLLWVLLLAPLSGLGQEYDILIRKGRVVDGTGNPWICADVGVTGDRITLLGRAPANATARRVIDAKGLVVAPGFIDMLEQSEWNLLIDNQAFSKLTQGITTGITGEGGSIAPQNERTLPDRRDFLQHYHLTVDWRDLEGYFRRLERQGAGINLGTFVGATQVRKYVLGSVDRAPTAEELARMEQLVDAAMRQGAMGVSTSLIYAPAFYAKTGELIAMAKVASKYGGIYATHIRNEGDREMQALEEAFRIGREANIPVEIWHLKVSGRQNWGKMRDVIAAIEAARASGTDVTADQYPYTASATSLGATIPPKYHEGGSEEFVNRLKDPQVRTAIRQELTGGDEKTENMWRGTGGPQGILVSSVLDPSLRHYEGKTIAQIAAGEHKDPLDALLDLVIAGKDHVGAVYFTMNEDDVKHAMQQQFVSVGTDAGAVNIRGPLNESKTHPRAYGSFARILGRYVRDQRLLTLEQAIRKFTSLPAQRVGLRDRGTLRTGGFADITVFDLAAVNDVATFEDPHRPSIGIEYVLVNGVISLDQGKLTGRLGGRPLRGPGYQAHGGVQP
ncbi:MAG TPA: D-aminoacylase [Candidatus Acidoferrales bacterium]|nr:D-aminoacylase [Candidatus Acidoferrales bacterium]